MPTAALVATLPDQTARLYSLTINGADTRTTVDLSSIHVREAGPGGVSSMDFVVQDRLSEWGIPDGTEVQFLDVTNDALIFRGYVDGLEVSPMAAAGRYLTVSCVGVEAWLDWLKIHPTYNLAFFPASDLGHQVVVALAGRLSHPVLTIDVDLGATYGTRFKGVAYNVLGITTQAEKPAIGAGTSLREALDAVQRGVIKAFVSVVAPVPMLATVDFDLTLRVWPDYDGQVGPSVLFQPDDYTTLTITDTVAGTTAAAQLTYQREYGDILHEVRIIGFDATSSGLFGDGSGVRGAQGVVTDTGITTAVDAEIAAVNFLAAQAPVTRGTLTIENYTPPNGTVHAGSLLALTDAGSGATGTYRIYSIDKTFNVNGTQNWTVAFGGSRPSAIRLIRKFTRDASVWGTVRGVPAS